MAVCYTNLNTTAKERTMSCNRENVAWKSLDGTWNQGFYDYTVWGEDHEWDVDYDYTRFHWLSRGHISMESARNSWKGSNPGMWTVENDPEQVRELEKLAADFERRKALR